MNLSSIAGIAGPGDPDNGGRAVPIADEPGESVLLLNRQRTARADWDEVRRFLRRLSTEAKRHRNVVSRSGFAVCLLSDSGIRRYNKQFRGADCPTDVLSFPAGRRENGSWEDGGGYLGDVLISVETARENARRYGLRLEEEIEVLALHGVLHLLGYDHERDAGEMARVERRWSERLGLPENLTGRARSRGPGRIARRRWQR
ncbi:MAG: rRNA maturation RNase YbeY [Terriglobia bacterium]